MTRLQVISDMLGGHAFDLSADHITIGRAADNMICLNHASVSKHHAVLAIDGGTFKLSDLESTNGTIVNGHHIVCTQLRDGDRILLGEVELRFTRNEKTRPQPISLPGQATTAASSLLELIGKTRPKDQAIIAAPPKPKSNGDSEKPNGDSARSLPSPPLRSREFAVRSSRILSRFRFRLRAPPPPVSLQDADATAEVIPMVMEASNSPPPVREALPLPFADHRKKEPELRLKPTPPVSPIKVQKPLPTRPGGALLLAPDQPADATGKIVPAHAPRSGTGVGFYTGLSGVGLLSLIVGYSGQNDALKFLGFVGLTTGALCAFFCFRFGSLVTPPKKRI